MPNTTATIERPLYQSAGFLAFLAACLLGAPLTSAQAQSQLDPSLSNPPEAQLALPGQEAAQPSTPPLPETAPTPSAAPATAAAAPSVATPAPTGNADLCPAALSDPAGTPGDLPQVQRDIERFALCAERAQLIERLNQSALASRDDNRAMLGLTIPQELVDAAKAPATPAGTFPMPPALAPLPADILAGADVGSGPAAAGSPAPMAEPEKPRQWQIQQIYGAGRAIKARLVSPEGTVVVADRGETLAGDVRVLAITPDGVTLRIKGKPERLSWTEQQADAANTDMP